MIRLIMHVIFLEINRLRPWRDENQISGDRITGKQSNNLNAYEALPL